MSFKYTPATLRKMEQLFEEAMYTVRYEKGTFTSGYCILESRKLAIINKFLPIEGRINALLEILPTIPVNEESLSGEMQRWYAGVINHKTDGNAESVQSAMKL